jgi:hypothetical protein
VQSNDLPVDQSGDFVRCEPNGAQRRLSIHECATSKGVPLFQLSCTEPPLMRLTPAA